MCDDSPYSSDNGGVISYLPHEVYQALWDNRADPCVTAVFSTSCEDLSVQDAAGNVVLKISNGKVRTLRDDVIPVRATDGADGTCVLECWMNPGTYLVINEDPDQALSFTFTGQQGEVEVETEAEEVLCTVDDEQDVQEVEVVKAKKGAKLKATLRNIAKQVAIRTSSDVGSKLLLFAGKLILRLILGSAVDCFLVNGQAADVNDYLEQENEKVQQQENEQAAEPEFEDEELLCTNSAADTDAAPADVESSPDGTDDL